MPATAEAFWAIGRREGDCLIWTGFVNHEGYGHASYGSRQYRAHRLAWILTHGPIPAGMIVCHRCDTPGCIEPSHLFLGTQADNIADRDQKGRRASTAGTRNGNAKLSVRDVAEIRRRAGLGEVGRRLAAEFGVSPATVSEIKNARHWKVAV